MDTKKCDDCLAEIPQKAKKCSHCGGKQKTKYGAKHLIAGLFILGWVMWSFGSSSEEMNIPDGQKAYAIAQNYVELTLKSPSTADFPLGSGKGLGDGRYKIISYVDSQNSFGATIRTNWSATIKHLGGDWSLSKNWELEELIMDGEIIYP